MGHVFSQMSLGWNRTYLLEKNPMKYLVSSDMTFIKELDRCFSGKSPSLYPSYNKYAQDVWMDAPNSVSHSWVCLPDWGRNPLNPFCVWLGASWTMRRYILFLNILSTLNLFIWTMFSNSLIIQLFSELTTQHLSWTVGIKAGHSVSVLSTKVNLVYPIWHLHIQGSHSFF